MARIETAAGQSVELVRDVRSGAEIVREIVGRAVDVIRASSSSVIT